MTSGSSGVLWRCVKPTPDMRSSFSRLSRTPTVRLTLSAIRQVSSDFCRKCRTSHAEIPVTRHPAAIDCAGNPDQRESVLVRNGMDCAIPPVCSSHVGPFQPESEEDWEHGSMIR